MPRKKKDSFGPGLVATMSYQDYVKAPGLRQSALALFDRSPAHYKAAVEAPPEEETPATIFGTLFHTALFEPDKLSTAYHVRPETYQNKAGDTKKWHGGATECKDWLFAHSDRPNITHAEQDALLSIRKSVLEHPSAKLAMVGGMSEHCMFAKDPVTGIWLKARPDRLTGNAIVDGKSTIDASPREFARSIFKYHYDVQAAWYLDIANWLGMDKKHFVFIAVEKEPPYAVAVYELDEESIECGRMKYRRWIDLFALCSELNDWPGYDPAITTISLPYWAKSLESPQLLLGPSPDMKHNLLK